MPSISDGSIGSALGGTSSGGDVSLFAPPSTRILQDSVIGVSQE